MKKLFVLLPLLAVLSSFTVLEGTKYFSRTGHIWFFSTTAVEDIEAHNHQTISVLDVESGTLEFSVLMKGFEFEKALMQEHFNENYVESEKFPKTTFKGKIENIEAINFTKDGTYPAKISGDMTLHGVTNKVSTAGKFIVKEGKVKGISKFSLPLAAYNIVIPKMVKDKIQENIEINVDVDYQLLKK